MEYITLVGKILSRQKTPDRHTLVSLFKPREKEERDHGILYFVLEIMSPDPAMARVIKLIETTVIEEYYQELGSAVDSLERSLTKVNERLSYLADEGEVGWIGKINGVIAVLEKDVLHVTQSGTSEAYLVRDERITHITENLSSSAEKPNPIVTFINIASGQLVLGDRCIISTSELFYHFSIDDLRRIIAKFTPAAAASYIVKSLRREEVESINALVLELASEGSTEWNKEDNSAAWFGDDTETPSAPKIDPTQAAQKVTPIIQFFVRRSQESIEKSLEKSKVVYKEQISVGVSKFSQEASRRVSEKIQDFQKRRSTDRIDTLRETPASAPQGQSSAITDHTTAEKPQPDLFTAPRKNPLLPIFVGGRKISQQAKNYIAASKERSQLFVLFSLLLIVALIASGGYSYQNNKSEVKKQAVEEQYQAIKTKAEGAIKAQKLGDDTKARALLAEAQTSIQGLLSSAYLSQEIKNLSITIDQSVEQLFNISRLATPELVTDFISFDPTVKIDGLYKKGAGFLSFDRERNSVLYYNPETNTVEKLEAAYFEGQFTDLLATDDGNAIFLTQSPNQVYAYNSTSNTITAGTQISGEPWPKASAIGTYFTNIYLAVPDERQIFKYNGLAGNYGSKTPYIVDAGDADLSKIVDIAIDGSVYALTSDGKIHQFLSGTKTAFQITGMPALSNNSDPKKAAISGLVAPTKLVLGKNTEEIFVADAGARRVVIFNKEGVYQRQFISDKFMDINDIWVDSNNRILFVLSGTQIYKIPL